MQMVDTRAAMTSAELISHYAAIRKKLFYVPPKKIVVNRQPKRIDPDKRGKRPLWCLKTIFFDEHVRVWHKINEEKKQKEEKIYKRSVTPMWKLAPTNFNYHMVLFLKRRLHEETNGEYGIVDEKKPLNEIFAEVLEFFDGVTVKHVNGHQRTKGIVLPRQLCMWEVKRQRPDLSYPEIGRRMGGKDHTSVLAACRKIDRLKASGELDWYFSSRGY